MEYQQEILYGVEKCEIIKTGKKEIGEINKEEFQNMKSEIRRNSSYRKKCIKRICKWNWK